jgi:hypothetical protein
MKFTLKKILALFAVLVLPVAILAQVAAAPAAPAATSSIKELFIQVVVPALFTAIAAIVTWGGKALIDLINAKTKNQLVAGILARLTSAVQVAVMDVNGTVKAAYLEAVKDGPITPEEKSRLKAIAIAKVKEHLGMKGLGELVTILGVNSTLIDSFLGSHIEAAIEGMKPGAAPVTTPAIDPAVSSVDPK